MRPVKLEIEGFGSYRERTKVNFEDTDLFVLTGTTGAGKSTIIDAIAFALYGAVPRYDHSTKVGPAISQGLNQARIRLDFEVNGDRYTAVRVVRRTAGGGASTKEARLVDANGNVLASTAPDLTKVIRERVVGLEFRQFTKCVVLPQGDFAEFLRAKPAERWKLLSRLLGLDRYEELRARANKRAGKLANELAALKQQLADPRFVRATKAAVADAKRQLAAREELHRSVAEADTRGQKLRKERDQARQLAGQAERQARDLGQVAAPRDLAELANTRRRVQETVRQAEADLVQASEAAEAAERCRADLGDRTALEMTKKQWQTLAVLRSRRTRQAAAVTAASESEGQARHQRDAAERKAEDASQRREALRSARSAADLARHLQSGGRCPVCLQLVEEMPGHETPSDLAEADRALASAKADARYRAKELQVASRAAAAAAAALKGTENDLNDRERALADAPALPEVEQRLQAIEQAGQEARARKLDREKVRSGLDRRRRRLAAAEANLRGARDKLAASVGRMQGIGLEPPAADGPNLVDRWKTFEEWAREQGDIALRVARGAQSHAAAKQSAMDEIAGETARLCAAQDIVVGDGDRPGDRCLEAVVETKALLRQLVEDRGRAKSLQEESVVVKKRTDVAKELARLLGTRHFQGWLQNQILRELADTASERLRDLSTGGYSLDLADDNSFLVVDHANADERRSARTLSGGEIFLASLALALALGEEISTMALEGAGSASSLDALFLDEGFGTLDPDTLDVVATALEELGAGGRMVGLVTHVPELADRIPVQYRVTKRGNSSAVERVIQ